MKLACLHLTLLLTLSLAAYAQKSVERIEIKGGSAAWENFYREIYRYPEFKTGIVEYKNGKQFRGNLNYNKVLGTIQFLDEKGDTLALSNEEMIRSVMIDDDEYFYVAPDCMQEVKDAGELRLVKNERLRIADKQKVGGLGIPNSTGTIDSYDRIDSKVNYNQIDINEKLLLNKTTRFFLETAKHELVPASKKNILNLFPKHEAQIKEYIKNHQIDFTREDHLAELIGFLAQL